MRSDTGHPEATLDCGDVRDRIPLRGLGKLDHNEVRAMDAHLAHCAECRDEVALIRLITSARVDPPRHLLPAILEAVEGGGRVGTSVGRRRGRRNVLMVLPAAAAVVLAIGIGTFWASDPAPQPQWSLALESDVSTAWFGNEWMVAGEPLLEALPDEVLRSLIEEMER